MGGVFAWARGGGTAFVLFTVDVVLVMGEGEKKKCVFRHRFLLWLVDVLLLHLSYQSAPLSKTKNTFFPPLHLEHRERLSIQSITQ